MIEGSVEMMGRKEINSRSMSQVASDSRLAMYRSWSILRSKSPIIFALKWARSGSARCVAVSCCDGQSMSRSGGVVEIGVWDYDAHTPNFPSLSEVHASYPPTPSSPPFHRASLPQSIPTLLAHYGLHRRVFVARILPVTLSFSLSHSSFRPDYTCIGYARMAASAASPAPSNQKPIICLRVSLSLYVVLCNFNGELRERM